MLNDNRKTGYRLGICLEICSKEINSIIGS